ncbi:MAG: hypothetical protein RIR51_775 [Bacteroidota bacterium]|jgi:AraC-like DNA-binding protein
MEKLESLEEFYKRKFDWIPENIHSNIGHVNIFKLPHKNTEPVPYRRRDFFKILLCKGESRIHYADHVYHIKKQSLVFSNPFIPYKWESIDENLSGYYVVFNPKFFIKHSEINQYEVFKPHGVHAFDLDDKQFEDVSKIFEEIENEIISDYKYKYEAIRNKIFDLIHFALKTTPSSRLKNLPINANNRIYYLFIELLERQFPIDENFDSIKLKSPSDFAEQLNIHVNHLNRSIKQISQLTTSQIISLRLYQEAKILLKQGNLNISQIAYSLGFNEPSHFNIFFKKFEGKSPSNYRNNI